MSQQEACSRLSFLCFVPHTVLVCLCMPVSGGQATNASETLEGQNLTMAGVSFVNRTLLRPWFIMFTGHQVDDQSIDVQDRSHFSDIMFMLNDAKVMDHVHT